VDVFDRKANSLDYALLGRHLGLGVMSHSGLTCGSRVGNGSKGDHDYDNQSKPQLHASLLMK